MSRKVAELDSEELARVKKMYMSYSPYAEIARQYDLAATSVAYHCKKWRDEREMMKAELFAQFSSNKKVHFTKMSEASITIIQRALEDMAGREIPPTVREAKDAVTILESLDKITRLDDGNPTEIVAEKPTEIKDIQARLRLDPFYEEIEDVEINEAVTEYTIKGESSSDDVPSESDSDGRDEGHLSSGSSSSES